MREGITKHESDLAANAARITAALAEADQDIRRYVLVSDQTKAQLCQAITRLRKQLDAIERELIEQSGTELSLAGTRRPGQN